MSRDLPRGWRHICFGEIARDVSERNRNRLKIPVLSVTKYDGFVPSEEYFKKRVFSADTENYKVVRRGQFAYATIHLDEGSIDVLTDFEAGLISPMYSVFELNEAQADPDFILRLFKHFSNNGRFDALGNGGVNRRKSISFSTLSRLELALPPLHEQHRIAEILSSVDDAIAATRAVIEQTKKVKRGVLERLLTKGIGHTRFNQTEIGEIPEEWEVVELDSITPPDRKITYGIVQAGPNYPEGVPYIRVSDMGEYQIDEGSVLRTSPEIAGKYLRSELRPGDIVFALRGKIGHVVRTPKSLAGANLTQGTARIACGGRVLSEFLLLALRSPQSERQYKREIKGSTFQELTLGSLKRIRVPLPPLEEQKLLARRIEDVEAGLRSSERSLLSLLEAKSALMSDLLSGRKRVAEALPLAAE